MVIEKTSTTIRNFADMNGNATDMTPCAMMKETTEEADAVKTTTGAIIITTLDVLVNNTNLTGTTNHGPHVTTTTLASNVTEVETMETTTEMIPTPEGYDVTPA